MNIIHASYQIMNPDLDDPKTMLDIYRRIEKAGRICYKSVNETDESNMDRFQFIRERIRQGHESILEHASMTVKFTVDRGVSHELVRHRLASFSQESTRYCNYQKDRFGKEITVIEPVFFKDIPKDVRERIIHSVELKTPSSLDPSLLSRSEERYYCWADICHAAEDAYFRLLELDLTPEAARSVLPNSLKTEVVMTANMREWRHILKLRAAGESGKPHPQMLEVMVPLLNELRLRLPILFEDIHPI